MSAGRWAAERTVPLRDEAPDLAEFRADVIGGLSAARRSLPSKYLYDDRGAELFEQITELAAYYPTRADRAILEEYGREIGQLLGPRCRIVEFGSGSATKTELLLEHLDRPAAYVPVDISRTQLIATAARLSRRFPNLTVLPVWADYNGVVDLPHATAGERRTVVFFPGSTIGNFEPHDTVRFLARIGRLVGRGGAALIGVDRQKDPALLELAYDDPEGVTAAFNRNLLVRINRELGANFDVEQFDHRAVYDSAAGRIEMHLVSLADQIVQVPNGTPGTTTFAFRRGESIVSEHSYKYTIAGFSALVLRAGLRVEHVWSDREELFSTYLLRT